jgi:hypothetical protein
MTDYGLPILKTFDRETVIAVMTVVTFVTTCKMYNHFIAKPKESYSDVDITKFTILGVFSVFATKGVVTALFERPIDLSASVGLTSSFTSATPEVKVTPKLPSLVKLVR